MNQSTEIAFRLGNFLGLCENSCNSSRSCGRVLGGEHLRVVGRPKNTVRGGKHAKNILCCECVAGVCKINVANVYPLYIFRDF